MILSYIKKCGIFALHVIKSTFTVYFIDLNLIEIYYLRHQSQLVFNLNSYRFSCELLSKFIIFVISHSSMIFCLF